MSPIQSYARSAKPGEDLNIKTRRCKAAHVEIVYSSVAGTIAVRSAGWPVVVCRVNPQLVQGAA